MTPVSAHLSIEGKKVWGYVFPDGLVPVAETEPVGRDLGNEGKILSYMIAWDDLKPEQRARILQHLAFLFHASEFEIENTILRVGLPLRAKLVSSIVADRRFLI